jgi:hypothetical protein
VEGFSLLSGRGTQKTSCDFMGSRTLKDLKNPILAGLMRGIKAAEFSSAARCVFDMCDFIAGEMAAVHRTIIWFRRALF